MLTRGAPDPDPDPAGSEVGSGKYWPDPQMYIVHNYDIKHHSIFHSRNWRMTIQYRIRKLTDTVNSVQYSLSQTN